MRRVESRDRVGRGRWRLALGVLVAVSLLAPVTALAAGVKFLRMQSRKDFMAGTLAGVSVDSLGTLELADRAARVADLEEPFLFSAAAHPLGWVVGTGNSGRVLLIDREGATTTLFEAPEPEVFAVWADDDGTVYAGTSPNGKVYRLHEGLSEVFFDPGQTYIWDLVRNAAGSLLVATGTEGKLFGVDSQGHGEVLYDTEDTHVRTLEPLAGGEVLVGTAGRGLILEVGPDGAARTLHDAVEPEVVAFARNPDGSWYAAVLASEASLVDLARGREAAEKEDREAETKAGGEGDSAVGAIVAWGRGVRKSERSGRRRAFREFVTRVGRATLAYAASTNSGDRPHTSGSARKAKLASLSARLRSPRPTNSQA